MGDRSVLCAPDSFKGTFRAAEVAAALARGVEAAGLRGEALPVADGGDGTMEALLLALGGETAGAEVTAPLGRPVTAGFALLEDGATALVEMAQASGLHLVAEDERDAEAASTYGTGELILAAIEAGAAEVLIAVGGSATTDGGAGAITAIEDGGGLGDARLMVICDVKTPFERAAEVYGPQKGADAAAVKRLTARLRSLARKLPRDPVGVPMSGAAGGLSGGLYAAFGATLVPGANFVLDALGFDERMRASWCVITGEGRIDAQTLQGKIVGELATRCRQAGVPSHAVVGTNDLGLFEQRLLDIEGLEEATTLDDVEAAAERIVRVQLGG
jgi:glycerate 2-kinase